MFPLRSLLEHHCVHPLCAGHCVQQLRPTGLPCSELTACLAFRVVARRGPTSAMRVRLAAAGVQGTGTRPWVAERTERLSVQDGGRGSRCTRKEGCARPRGGSVGVGRTWRRGSPSPCWQSPGRDRQAPWTEAGEPQVAVRSPSLTCEFLGETHQLCGCLRSGQPPCGRRMLPTHARSPGDPGEGLLLARPVSSLLGRPSHHSPAWMRAAWGWVHVCPVGGRLPDAARVVVVSLRLSGSDRDLAACWGQLHRRGG